MIYVFTIPACGGVTIQTIIESQERLDLEAIADAWVTSLIGAPPVDRDSGCTIFEKEKPTANSFPKRKEQWRTKFSKLKLEDFVEVLCRIHGCKNLTWEESTIGRFGIQPINAPDGCGDQ